MGPAKGNAVNMTSRHERSQAAGERAVDISLIGKHDAGFDTLYSDFEAWSVIHVNPRYPLMTNECIFCKYAGCFRRCPQDLYTSP
jgi:hypothetical protein